MKRAWIIPIAICLLSSAAWPFRWEKGPTQSYRMSTVVHMRDRWTGQEWIASYERYSSSIFPVFSEEDIEEKKEQIPEERQKKQDLEKKLAACEQDMKIHQEGHNEYIRIVSKQLTALKQAAELPKTIIDAQRSWVNAYNKNEETKREYYKQGDLAKKAAISDLQRLAWQKRNIATGVWAGLVALSAVMAGILFMRDSRSQKASGL